MPDDETLFHFYRMWTGMADITDPEQPAMPADFVLSRLWEFPAVGRVHTLEGDILAALMPSSKIDAYGNPTEWLFADNDIRLTEKGKVARTIGPVCWMEHPIKERVGRHAAFAGHAWTALYRNLTAMGAAATILNSGIGKQDANVQAMQDVMTGSDIFGVQFKTDSPKAEIVLNNIRDFSGGIMLSMGMVLTDALSRLGIDSRASPKLSGVSPDELAGSAAATQLVSAWDHSRIEEFCKAQNLVVEWRQSAYPPDLGTSSTGLTDSDMSENSEGGP